MTDSLRDRIAAVIAQHAVCMCGEWAENMTEQAQHQADAVIEALKDDYVIVDTRGCQDSWHQGVGAPFQCPSCGQWMGELSV